MPDSNPPPDQTNRDLANWWFQSTGKLSLIFIICVTSPVVFSIVRKFVPGQPSWIRAASFGIIALAALWGIFRPKKLPGWLSIILWIWALIQIVYLAPLVMSNPAMAPLVAIVYLVPLLLPRIGYLTVKTPDGIVTLGKYCATIILFLTLAGLATIIFGYEILPFWLRATEQAREVGEQILKGSFRVPSFLFSTVRVLAHTLLGLLYTIYAVICIKQIRKQRRLYWWIIAVCGLAMVYMLGRRAVTLASLPGLIYCSYRERFGCLPTLLLSIVLVSLTWVIDTFNLFMTNRPGIPNRFELYENLSIYERLEQFFGLIQEWLTLSPWGNFLGYASPIARNFEIQHEYFFIEFGAAQLIAEMGVIGLIGFPLVVFFLITNLIKRSQRLTIHPVIVVFILFQVVMFSLYFFKSLSFLMIGTYDHLLFWGLFGIGASLIDREKKCRQNQG